MHFFLSWVTDGGMACGILSLCDEPQPAGGEWEEHSTVNIALGFHSEGPRLNPPPGTCERY